MEQASKNSIFGDELSINLFADALLASRDMKTLIDNPNERASAMKPLSLFLITLLAVGALSLCGCEFMEDNGTHLAHALERGAKKLRDSNLSEYIVKYEPLGGGHESYTITMVHSPAPLRLDAAGNVVGGGGGYLTVTGRQCGGTSYHERFVFTPADLAIAKSNAPTEVVLHKVGDRVDVVALR
jgi:hypothetical protein